MVVVFEVVLVVFCIDDTGMVIESNLNIDCLHLVYDVRKHWFVSLVEVLLESLTDAGSHFFFEA